jgi:hypothetical protein
LSKGHVFPRYLCGHRTPHREPRPEVL